MSESGATTPRPKAEKVDRISLRARNGAGKTFATHGGGAGFGAYAYCERRPAKPFEECAGALHADLKDRRPSSKTDLMVTWADCAIGVSSREPVAKSAIRNTSMSKPSPPIALEAYEKLAHAYSNIAAQKAENGFIEHPAIRKLLGDVSGKKVLDAGCGPGFMAHYLAEQRAAEIVGFDVSPTMIELAKKRNGQRAVFHIADMRYPLSFLQSEHFDIVTSSLALDYVKDWSAPLAEFRRVLKNKGRLIFSIQHPFGAYRWYQPPSAFGVHYVEAAWKGFCQEPVIVPDYYRSFDEIINPVIDAGFAIRKITEAKPIPELQARNPEKYAQASTFPTFMIVQARALPTGSAFVADPTSLGAAALG